MTNSEIEIITDRKDILALAGLDLYNSELSEKLTLFKGVDKTLRKRWTEKDLDVYLRKSIAVAISDNEFQKGPIVRGRKPKIKTDKEMIASLSESLNLEVMAVKHLYNEVKAALHLDESKDETRNYLSAQYYSNIDEIDLEIMNAETAKDKQKWYEVKMKMMDQLAKVRNLEEKQTNNITTVHGNVNNQQNIDKQMIIAQQKAMMDLANKFLPGKSE